MKTTPKKLVVLAFLAVFPTVQGSENPTGNISANAEVVRAGSFPKLNWDITYPAGITSVVDISPPGGILPKRDLMMQVRCLAADVQEKSYYYKRGYRYVQYRYISVAGHGRKNNENWKQLFYNIQPYVDPSKIVWNEEVEDGDEIQFTALANYSGANRYYSGQGSDNVLILKNGDYPPAYATWDSQSTLGTHIAPYLNENGAVEIGPRDLIVAFELTHVMNATGNNEGDMQDMIFLLTFVED